MPNADGSLALSVEGDAAGVSATDPKVAGALGRTARLDLTGVLSREREVSVSAAHVALDETAVQTGQGGGGAVRFIPFKASATLGALTVPDLDGIYTPDGDQYGLFAFAVAGTLSHQFFRAHAVTFDFDAMRLVVR